MQTKIRKLKIWLSALWKKMKMTESAFGELHTIRNKNYWLKAAFVSGAFVFIGILLVSDVTGIDFVSETGRVFVSGGLAVVVASILNFIRNRTIENNMIEAVSSKLELTVQETFRILQHKIYPAQVYICDDRNGDQNLFNKKLDDSMKRTTSFRFMSISGTYLLGKRLRRLQIRHEIDMQLLLQHPCDKANLETRARQLEGFESKASHELQEEIIESVIRAYVLQMENSCFKIRLRFHKAPPLCRLEFSGADDLFISYYKSQQGPKEWGPVAHYKHMQNDMENDVYRSFNHLFIHFWDSSGETELNFREGNYFRSPHDLISTMKENLKGCQDDLREIFSELAVAMILEKLIYERKTEHCETVLPAGYHEIMEWLDKGRLIVTTNEKNDDSSLEPQRCSKTHREGLWHRVVHIEIKNAQGKFFIWQRKKDGRYEIPGGHVSWIALLNRAETYIEAAQRELIEELNLPWIWKCSEAACKTKLGDRVKVSGVPFKNELPSTQGNNKEWVSIYELTWASDWDDPCKVELGQEGKKPTWSTLEEIKELHASGAGLNAALYHFLRRHTESV